MNARLKINQPLIIFLLLGIVLSSGCASSKSLATQRISVAYDESQANHRSKTPSISADGRYVAFASDATNLVSGDTNNATDVFLRDLSKQTTTRISVSGSGAEGDKSSYWPFISPDGRYITFTSDATNLVTNDTNAVGDVFLYIVESKQIQLISIALEGAPANDLSFWSSVTADGRYIVYMSQATNLVKSDTNEAWDIFMFDRSTGITSLISKANDGSQANSQSEYPVISADGHYIAYASDATNLVTGDTNGYRDVYEYDRQTDKVTRVSISTDGTQADNGTQVFALSISSEGKYVAFASLATTLVQDDTNKVWDIFVHDRDSGVTSRVSVSSDGVQANAGSYGVSLSPDGRYVAFGSNATNLVTGDTNGVTDVFVHDRNNGKTERVSIANDGTQANDSSGFTLVAPGGVDLAYGPLITTGGGKVVFMSNATNLVDGDTNSSQDIFIHTR